MSKHEEEKFREFLKKFSYEHLVGWQSAISFILPMSEVQTRLGSKLLAMFRIIDDVIKDRARKE